MRARSFSLIALPLLLAACGPKPPEGPENANPARNVVVRLVQPQQLDVKIKLPVVIQPKDTIELRAAAAGTLVSLPYNENELVPASSLPERRAEEADGFANALKERIVALDETIKLRGAKGGYLNQEDLDKFSADLDAMVQFTVMDDLAQLKPFATIDRRMLDQQYVEAREALGKAVRDLKRTMEYKQSTGSQKDDAAMQVILAHAAVNRIIAMIEDTYVCKKEVKTQISMSANLFGGAEEEHSGGAMVFPSWDEGQEFANRYAAGSPTVDDVVSRDPAAWESHDLGWASLAGHPELVLVPTGARFSLATRSITWGDEAGTNGGGERGIPFRGDTTYLDPTGFRVAMKQVRNDPAQWTIIGTSPQTTVCHKPSTVSGGGKSEISKSIADAITLGNAYVADFDADMDAVEAIFERDWADRYVDTSWNGQDHRPILGSDRSMGSVIKLLTPSAEFSDDHNAFIRSIPPHVLELVFVIKRAYRPEWGQDWRSHFSVSRVNGRPGNRLRLDGQQVLVDMLRVGFESDGSYRLFSLRPDYAAAVKVQTEDDITASTVVPSVDPADEGRSVKYVENCEGLLFQRPDDAIKPGYDTIAEADIATPGTFLSNFEPLDRAAAQAMRDDAISLSEFTAPMRNLITEFATATSSAPGATSGSAPAGYLACSARPRLVDGKPSKNPRYLQLRPDLADPVATRAAYTALRLHRGLAMDAPITTGVDVVAAGRRNNPPEPGAPALCAFSPLHYLELPELLMEFISSMTGKSPSTTGAGSEGAMTKSPFNALPTTYDLNAAFLSFALSEYDGWISGAGHVGPQVRVDHDISLLVPEVFARMTPQERDAQWLIEHGYLEPVADLEIDGRVVPASRLGHRITEAFTRTFLGRIFMHPTAVLTEAILRPETQDRQVFVDSVDVMVTTHERVARSYLEDGTIASACPPVRALLEIMANGTSSEGWTVHSPEFRALFTRESVLNSSWYAARLDAAQSAEVAELEAGIGALEAFLAESPDRAGLGERLADVRAARDEAATPAARERLVGTLGRQQAFR